MAPGVSATEVTTALFEASNRALAEGTNEIQRVVIARKLLGAR